MAELKIPFALDADHEITWPKDAVKGTLYFCPSCGDRVILRAGTIKVWHFAHKPNQTCSQETITHKSAKLLIQKAIRAWKAGKQQSPQISRRCRICRTPSLQSFPDKVTEALLEQPLTDGSVADVALMTGDKVVAIVEVLVTHAVGNEKKAGLPVPFIEVDGYKIIESPNILVPISDGFRPLICHGCLENYRKFRIKTQEIAALTGQPIPQSYYLCAPSQRWKCHKEILVYSWPGANAYSEHRPEQEPVPATVRHKYSDTVKQKYWANTCPFCRSLQGNFFLYSEPDGAFFSMGHEEEGPTDYREDLLKIAYHTQQNDEL